MRAMKKLWLCLSLFTLGGQDTRANSVLQGIYNNFKEGSNYTRPNSFHDQQAGYMTGGGMVVRTKNTNVNPFNLSLPRVNASCGKVDMFFGSMSLMSRQELKQLMQGIGSSAATYAFQLALKTMAPEVENLMSKLRETVMKMNAVELNSCQMGMQLVGSALAKGSKAEEEHCKNMSMTSDTDYFGTREKCNDVNERNRKMRELKSKAGHEDVLQGEYNLTWHIAKKLNFDEETARFAMSALGTVISKTDKFGPSQEEGSFRVETHYGFGAEEDFLEGYLKGGVQIDGYACVDQACTDVRKIKHSIDKQHALLTYFAKWIEVMRQSYMDNTMQPQRAAETIALLKDSSSLPLYRYIEVSAATGAVGLLDEALEYMVRQLLIMRTERLSVEIKTALTAMSKIQLDDSVIDGFKNHIDKVTENLKKQGRGYRRDAIYRLEQELKAHEKSVKAMRGF